MMRAWGHKETTMRKKKSVEVVLMKWRFSKDYSPWVQEKRVMGSHCFHHKSAGFPQQQQDWIQSAPSADIRVARLCEEGRWKEAVETAELCIHPFSVRTYSRLLKDCTRMKALVEAKRIHAHILRTIGLGSNIFLDNTLINTYAKCGDLLRARRVFDEMPNRNVFSWTMLIQAHANEEGQEEEALLLFQQMQWEGIKPDQVTCISTLKACASLKALEQGKWVHELIEKSRFGSDVFIGSALIDMYTKCGSLEDARNVFDRIDRRDVVLWSAMIAGYAQNGHGKEAIALFESMLREGVEPDPITFMALLKACVGMGDLEQGKWVHLLIKKRGFESNVFVGNTLVDMYAKCGAIEDARLVFDGIPQRNVVSWNAMIMGFAQQNRHGNKALRLFEKMQLEGVKPDEVTFISVLKACTSLADVKQGKQVHASIKKHGFEPNFYVGSTLVDMYAKCGCIQDAWQVFNGMRVRNVVSWNAMIAGYIHNGHGKEALALFERMEREGVEPNEATFVSVLKACSSISSLKEGKRVHVCIIKNRLESSAFVGSALVDMYAKCRSVEDARKVFDRMCTRDVVAWSAMIAGYAQIGDGMEALLLFEQMEHEGVKPDEFSFVSALKACASLAALEQCKGIHASIKRNMLESDIFVGNTLVDTYAKCGSLEEAQRFFNGMERRNVVSWNAMITGCAQHGHGKEALLLFERMQCEGVKPDEATFVSVLFACSHEGLVNEVGHLLNSMSREHGITPTIEHYTCVVGLLGHSGHLIEAEDFINKMPMQPTFVNWMALLSACQIHGNTDIGRRAFKSVLELEQKDAVVAAFVMLSDIYSASGRQDEVTNLRKEMEAVGMKRKPGCSWIEVNGGKVAFIPRRC